MKNIIFKVSALWGMVIALSIFPGPICEATPSGKPVVIRKKIAVATEETGANKDQRRPNPDQKITVLKPKSDLSTAPKAAAGKKIVGANAAYPGNSGPGYDPAGKIDPFKPLFRATPKILPSSATYADNDRKRTTALEKIDLSQLALTGIILAASGNKALVQEASGRGHVVTKGTYIGTHGGRVAEVLKDKVIVKEKMKDVMGKLYLQKTEMKLNKKNS